MKFNNKGFTLVEVIITVGILGVITLIAFPAILALQSSNTNTKYEAYTDLLGSNARVYVNSFEKDIFGDVKEDEDSCFILDYETMYNNDLIKDIDVEGVSCSNSDPQDIKTFVKVIKDSKGYDYETSIFCYDGNGDKVYSEGESVSTTGCDMIDEDGPSIEIVSNTDVVDIDDIGSKNYKKNHDLVIKVEDKSGLVENVEIKYGWSLNGADPTSYITHSFNNNYGVNELSIPMSTDDQDKIYDKNDIWTLQVEAVNLFDTEGNGDSESVKSNFAIDNTAPTTPVLVPISQHEANAYINKWTNKSFTLKFSSTDTMSGIGQWKYSYEDSGNWVDYKDNTMDKGTFTTTAFSKQRNDKVFVQVCDNAGNCSNSFQGNIMIDTGKPTVPTSKVRYDSPSGTVRSNSDTNWTNRTLWWGEFKGVDSFSGINRYEYSSNCTGSITGTLRTSGYTYSSTTNYKFCIRSVDNAGNVSAWSSPTYLKVDKTPPSCSVGGGRGWTNQNVTLIGYCSDGNSGCRGNVSKTFTSGNGNYSPGVIYDKVGNATTCPATGSVHIDKTPPSVPSIYNPTGGNWTNTNFSLTYSSYDSLTGVAYYQWCYDNKNWITYSNSAANTFVSTAFSKERNQYVYVRACDWLGNCSNSAATTIRIDKTPPVAWIDTPSGDYTASSKWIGGYGHDTGSVQSGFNRIELYLFKDGVQVYSAKDYNVGEIAAEIYAGNHYEPFNIDVWDNAGNKTNVSAWYAMRNPEPPPPSYPTNKPNNCMIRGDIKQYGSSWKCSHGHVRDYWYNIYCTDDGYTLRKPERDKDGVGTRACAVNPYGPDQGWIIVSGM